MLLKITYFRKSPKPALPPCVNVSQCISMTSVHPAVLCAVKALAGLVVGKSLQEIVSNFRGFYRLLTSDGQMRWVRATSNKYKWNHSVQFEPH